MSDDTRGDNFKPMGICLVDAASARIRALTPDGEEHINTSMLQRLIQLSLLGLGFAPAFAADPPYKVDHAAPLNATEKTLEENEKYSLVRVEFNGIAGDRVPGHLYLPKGKSGRSGRTGVRS